MSQLPQLLQLLDISTAITHIPQAIHGGLSPSPNKIYITFLRRSLTCDSIVVRAAQVQAMHGLLSYPRATAISLVSSGLEPSK
jgi:hypothetical protein